MSTEPLPDFTPMVPASRLPGAVVTRPAAPRTVMVAFWMLLAGCAIALATQTAALVLVAGGGFVANSSYIVGGLIAIGLRALIAFGVRRGSKVARALVTLFAFVGVLGLFRPDPLAVVLVALVIAAAILLWVRPSARYFRAVAAAVAAAKIS